jgi:ribosomal RNA-processing protein 36
MKKTKKDEKVSYLVQRMENQKREYQKKTKIQSKPKDTNYFPNKRKQRAEELLNKFKELKSAGKLDKYLDKKRKKESGKSRKKMNIEK